MEKIKIPTNGKGKVLTMDLVREIAGTELFKSDGKNLFKVNKVHRVFERIENLTVFIKILKKDVLHPDEADNIPKKFLETVYDELLVNSAIQFEAATLEHPHLLNVSNGILNLQKLTFEEVSEDNQFYFRYWLDFEYLECREEPPEILKAFIEKSIDKNDHVLFFEALGFIISDVQGKRKAPLFYGKSGSGKSTIANLIQKVVKPANVVTDYRMKQMSDGFSVGNIVQSKLNIADEFDVSSPKSLETFKSIVSGAQFTVSQKYMDDSTVKAKAKCLFCSNKLPDPKGLDPEAIYNRLLIINFTGKIPEKEQNEGLLDELYAERNAIFSYEGLEISLL